MKNGRMGINPPTMKAVNIINPSFKGFSKRSSKSPSSSFIIESNQYSLLLVIRLTIKFSSFSVKSAFFGIIDEFPLVLFQEPLQSFIFPV